MINRKFFFDHVRQTLFDGKLKLSQVNGLNAILDEWEKNWAKNDDRWLAYMLATAHHETDRTMQPIEEYGKGKNYAYGKHLKMTRKAYTDTPALFYGRGFVQLTWYENYQKAGKKLKVDLLHHPELALDLSNATKIMFYGMTEGWFTGKKLSQYFNPTTSDWANARRIINGKDKAQLIASHALNYYSSISYTL
ncbi:MAG: hypothetical protein JST36_05520 [Bacteroidetes bacterium]|nr:hypothetical protein [Bacteroidota bacterium]